MSAMKIDVDALDLVEKSEEIFNQIYKDIPVGFNINKPSSVVHNPDRALSVHHRDLTDEGRAIAQDKDYRNAVGSLGGGNHFIEIGHDEEDQVWAVIHSGSRGVGANIAKHYMKLASGGQKAKEGHYGLDVNTEAGQGYIIDMEWALQFALDNRKEMLRRVENAVNKVCGNNGISYLDSGDFINRNHNHAELKDGNWVHRKGATHSEEGMMGVIPGNMRDGSFIVRGKGNSDSLCSSSHGAGRVLSRKKAKEQVKLEDFKETMKNVQAKVDEKTIDESPFAYKNIFDVIDQQKDLIDVIHHVKPLINIKG